MATRRRSSRAEDVVSLNRGRRRFFASPPSEPGLRFTQVATAQEEARIAASALPLVRAQPNPGVPVDPVGVDAHCLDEGLQGLVEKLVAAEIDPLRPPQRLRHSGTDLMPEQRSDSFPLLDRAVELEPAVR